MFSPPNNFYAVLKDKLVVPVPFSERMAVEQALKDRHLDQHQIGKALVSTVFLGINHGWNGRDLWFETMIFGGTHDGYQERYETYDEALAGHRKALNLVIERD